MTSLALGTVQFGMPYGIANRSGMPARAEVAAMLDLALEAGVQGLDTARGYGASEWLLGSLVGRHPSWRIVTKLAPDVDDGKLPLSTALVRTAQSIALSRRALRRAHLDALLLHRASHRTAYGGALWRHLRRERERGGISALGVSAANPEEALALLEDPEVELIQVASSLLDQRLWRTGFFQRAQDKQVRIHVRSIFLQGAAHLDPAALPSQLAPCQAPLESIQTFARARGVELREAFLAFARALPVEQVIVGCDNLEQLQLLLADWQRAAIPAGDVLKFAREIPALESAVLDPSQWRRSAPRQHSAGARRPAPGDSLPSLPCGP